MFVVNVLSCCVFFFKQKTAYEMRISDWSSDVCSSDLPAHSSAWTGWKSTPDCGSRGGPAGLPLAARPEACRIRRSRFPNSIHRQRRSEEHTSELQSLMRISYAVFCLKKKTTHTTSNKTY